MAHFLPPAMMAFFRAPPPLPYKPPVEPRKMPPYSGVAQFIDRFKDPVPEPVKMETPQEQKTKRKAEKEAVAAAALAEAKAKWDPSTPADPSLVTEDAYKTLFVGRLSYELDENDIKTEFEYYGLVKKVRLVRDRQNKSRGYAFVEFESSRDLEAAFKDADGRKLRGRRIVVDVERGRTVPGFTPVRLGGELGGATRRGKKVHGRQVLDASSNSSRNGGGGGGGGSGRPYSSSSSTASSHRRSSRHDHRRSRSRSPRRYSSSSRSGGGSSHRSRSGSRHKRSSSPSRYHGHDDRDRKRYRRDDKTDGEGY